MDLTSPLFNAESPKIEGADSQIPVVFSYQEIGILERERNAVTAVMRVYISRASRLQPEAREMSCEELLKAFALTPFSFTFYRDHG